MIGSFKLILDGQVMFLELVFADPSQSMIHFSLEFDIVSRWVFLFEMFFDLQSTFFICVKSLFRIVIFFKKAGPLIQNFYLDLFQFLIIFFVIVLPSRDFLIRSVSLCCLCCDFSCIRSFLSIQSSYLLLLLKICWLCSI